MLILVLAYLAGTVGASFLRQQILLFPVSSSKPHTASKAAALEDIPQDQDEFSDILVRNIFEAQRKEVEIAPLPLAPPPENEIVTEEPKVKEEAVAITSLKLSLSGTMLSSNYAFAFISAKGNLRNYTIFSVGDCFRPKTVRADPTCNSTSVKIFSIEDRKVILLHQGRKEILFMETTAADKAQAAAFVPAPAHRPAPVRPARVQPKPARIIPKKVKPRSIPKFKSPEPAAPEGNSFHFQREWVDEQLANFNKLLNDARVVPTTKKGKTLFMFKFIKPESIFQKLGLAQNDIILEINGFRVDTLPKALKLLETLQSEREIVLKIEREEKPVVFRYYID